MNTRNNSNLIGWSIIAGLVFSYISFNIWYRQSFCTPDLYISENSATSHQAHFYQSGFTDRGWNFCVKPTTHKKPSLVTSLDLDLMAQQRRFMGAEWSTDGQVVAVRLKTESTPVVETTNSEGVVTIGSDYSKRSYFEGWTYAYDFHSAQTVMPHNSDWPSAQSNIEALVASHGGFSGHYVSREIMEQQCKSVWFWKIPKTSEQLVPGYPPQGVGSPEP